MLFEHPCVGNRPVLLGQRDGQLLQALVQLAQVLSDLCEVCRCTVGIGRARFKAAFNLRDPRVERGELLAYADQFLRDQFGALLKRDYAALD